MSADRPPRKSGVQVRPLGPADAAATLALRLEGLERHPEAFLTDPASERAGGVERQRLRLEENAASGGEAVLFGAFADDELLGITGLVRDRHAKQRHRACIVAVYVREPWRGRGVGGRLLDAAIAHARTLVGVEALYLSTAAGNEPALRTYRSRGFRAWGTEPDALRAAGRSYDEVHLQAPLDGATPRSAAASRP